MDVPGGDVHFIDQNRQQPELISCSCLNSSLLHTQVGRQSTAPKIDFKFLLLVCLQAGCSVLYVQVISLSGGKSSPADASALPEEKYWEHRRKMASGF